MRSFSIKYNKLFIYINWSIVSMLLVALLIQYFSINGDYSFMMYLAWQLFIVYFLILIKSIIRRGLFHIFTLYLLTLSLFAFNRIFISLFDPLFDFRYVETGLIITTIDNFISQKTLLLYTFFIVITNTVLEFLELTKKNKTSQHDNTINHNPYLYKLGKEMMIVLFVFALYRAFLEVKLLYGNRELLFLEGSADIGLPVYIRLASTFFQVGYFFLVASLPSKKQFIIASSIYLIVILPSVILGNRMELASLFLYILWFLNRVYFFRLGKIKIIVLLFSAIIGLQIIGIIRSGNDFQNISLSLLITSFLVSQSVSYNVLPLYITHKGILIPHSYPFILDSMVGGLTGYTGQNYEVLTHRATLGSHLGYSINQSYFFSGRSIGTSYIAEAYEFGLIGIILAAFILAIYIYIFNKKVISIRFLLLFSYLFFYPIITSPRASLFPSIYALLKYLIIMTISIILYNIIRYRKFSLHKFYK